MRVHTHAGTIEASLASRVQASLEHKHVETTVTLQFCPVLSFNRLFAFHDTLSVLLSTPQLHNMSKDYKTLKEDFVSNLTGSSLSDIGAVTFIVPVR